MAMDWRTRRLSRRYVLLFASMLAVLAFAATAGGALTPSTFEGDDGNLVVNGGSAKDWATPGLIDCTSNTKVGCALDKETGSTDDSFGQGTSENTEPPTPTEGSIPNNKSDLTRFYVANEKVSGNDYLYLAWERVQEPNGTTNMDFEFNQSETLSSNGVTPERTQDDLLIKYDLSQGGTNPTLGYHRWETAAAHDGVPASEVVATTPQQIAAICEAGNKFPCWGTEQGLAGSFEGAVNTAAVDDPIPPNATRSLSAFTFGEAAINLTTSGLFPAGACINYGSAYLKSRSSDSFTSELKDFIAPIDVNVSNCGSITIKKVTVPASTGDSFVFSASGGSISPTSFNLVHNGTQVYTNVLAGPYTFTESSVHTDYAFGSVSCVKTDGSTFSYDQANRQVTVTLAADDDVTCTFTNNRKPQLNLKKVFNPSDGETGTVNFTLNGNGFNNGGAGYGHNGETGFKNASLEDNTASEAGNTANLTNYVSTWQCTGTGFTTKSGTGTAILAADNLDLSYGDQVTCTFTNNRKPQLNLKKVFNPSGDTGTVNFTLNGTGFNNGGAGYGHNGETGFKNASLDNNTASEAGNTANLTNYVSTWQCTGTGFTTKSGTGTAIVVGDNLDLSYGDQVTCTFTNNRLPQIKVIKTVVGDTGARFDLYIDSTKYDNGGVGFGTTTTGSGFQNVSVGSHSVSELAHAGTTLSDFASKVECDSSKGSENPGTSHTFSVGYGDKVICTITNTKRKFTIVAYVCETTSGTPALYSSTVVLPYSATPPAGSSKASQATLPSGVEASTLCGLASNYPNLDSGPYDARITIGTTAAGGP